MFRSVFVVSTAQKKTHLSHGQISLIISSEARINSSMLTTLHLDLAGADYSLILVFMRMKGLEPPRLPASS